VVIPAGSFHMGSPDSEAGRDTNEGPVHEVHIAYRLAVGKYPVTRREWRQFVKTTGHPNASCSGTGDWESPVYLFPFSQEDNHPVVCIPWEDATAYTAWLTQKTGHHYRLLSEAEYEYVTRGGHTSRFFWGDSEGDLCRYVNNGNGSFCKIQFTYTSPVGYFQPNRFGLYDTTGNVLEWTQDCYRKNYKGAPTDGSARESGDCRQRAIRGAYWGSADDPFWFRSANRGGASTGEGFSAIGFRVARTP
jgi:formylglycine-generating enzyme required for sulfatase activity